MSRIRLRSIDLRPRRPRVAVHKSVIRVSDLEVVAYCSRRKAARTTKDWALVSCGKCLTRRSA